MKKNNFISGTFITTFCIILTKIMGAIYVIPFYMIIGSDGGALYGYAYDVYLFFMSLSTAGIPLAISKVSSEYQAMGYVKAKDRAFKLSKILAVVFSLVCFALVFCFAPWISRGILGGVNGSNSVRDITFVIRVISFAILIVPVMSVYRGYFEGHRYMSVPSYSQVIEQFFRVLIILVGSYVVIKVLRLSVSMGVAVALGGVGVGALISYLYMLNKYNKNKTKFKRRLIKVNEPLVSDRAIIRKVLVAAIPFIMIDLFKSLYNYIDVFSVVKGLSSVGFSGSDAEEVFSILSTWGAKFNMIILAISSGVIVNLIPSLTGAIYKKDYNLASKFVIKSLLMVLFLGIPLVLGISFLARPIWCLFYGKSLYGANVLSYYIFVGLFIALATVGVTALQCYRNYGGMFISLGIGVFLKFLFNNRLIIAFNKMSFPAYYGVITATIIGYVVSFIICLIIFNNRYGVKYEGLVKSLFDIMFGSILMIGILFIFRFIIPIYSSRRLVDLIIIIIYGFIGMGVYFCYSYRSGLLYRVFDKKSFNKMKKGLIER